MKNNINKVRGAAKKSCSLNLPLNFSLDNGLRFLGVKKPKKLLSTKYYFQFTDRNKCYTVLSSQRDKK